MARPDQVTSDNPDDNGAEYIKSKGDADASHGKPPIRNSALHKSAYAPSLDWHFAILLPAAVPFAVRIPVEK